MLLEILGKDGVQTVNLNRRKAIRERCLNCSCWDAREVTTCKFKDCDLYPFRMGRGKQDPKKRDLAIRRYCLWCQAGQRNEVRLCPSVKCSLHPYRMSVAVKSISKAKNVHIEATSEANSKGAMVWRVGNKREVKKGR